MTICGQGTLKCIITYFNPLIPDDLFYIQLDSYIQLNFDMFEDKYIVYSISIGPIKSFGTTKVWHGRLPNKQEIFDCHIESLFG